MQNSERSDLLTWFDVERRIAQCTNGLVALPTPILSVSVYSDSVELSVAQGSDREQIVTAVGSWFTEAEFEDSGAECRILLRIGTDSALSVNWSEEVGVWKKTPELVPLWRRLVYVGDGDTTEFRAPSAFDSGPTMIAFHSFKGGVGRTTSLIAFVVARIAQLAQRQARGRILIIDADTEAPGVTYWLSRAQRGSVSYVRLLEALHSPPTNVGEVLDYFAKEIQKNAIDVDGTQVFVLPAFVDQTDLLNAKISPEHLVRTPADAWALGDHLHRLASLLDVEHAFVDLRAGLSELSSPVLFDPRFHRFVVTTMAEQSLRGAELLLQTLRQVWNSLTSNDGARHPYIVLSMLTDALKTSTEYVDVRERLERAYGAINPAPVDDADSPEADELLQSFLTFFESNFATDLMVFGSLDQALTALRRSSLIESASTWFSTMEPPKVTLPAPTTIEQLDAQAKKLGETCQAKQFAEDQEPSDLLITEALRNLGRSFVEDLPNAVLIGAKGSGKTFSFLQISYAQTWREFLKRIGVVSSAAKEVLVLPLLRSNELGNANSSLVNRCFEDVQSQVAGKLGIAPPTLTLSEIQDRIEKQRLMASTQLSDWVSFWTSVMAHAVGSSATTLSELNQHVLTTGLSIVFLFDGIEDVLRNVLTDEVQRAAVEAIIELPNRIRELRDPAIGVLAFVREDYAKAVKTQNFGQFESRYGKFRLDWSPREFLQLILWLCADAEIGWASKQDIDTLETEKIVERLENLWGKKLGRDDAAEAYSARWVYAALSDLRGRLQARDAVRFLGYAAQQAGAKRLAAWSDRVLPPSAIRGALLPTSQKKVEEAIQEYAPLKEWVDKLVNIDSAKKKIPFVAEDLGLDGRLRQTLQEIGVIYEDIEKDAADRLYVPEIYRHGLSLGSGAGARPRVQALLQRALGALPF
ncbi:ParA family protein [Burkholderia diffusa]|uniref:ParA family protein n=1 Tax=Burkholderia diffusa TaxID=488732 RepID=UPI001581463D|nr:ParA family protein [Burkholderia diffusa]